MKDLLLRWAELEPERCKVHGDGWIEFELSDVRDVLITPEITDVDLKMGLLASIQVAVQNAIEIKGHFWEVSFEPAVETGKACYLAEIEEASTEQTIYRYDYTSAAAALLKAYLELLEKEAA